MHVVSVLWLEAVKKSNIRVPEKNYPALGAEYDNLSQICQVIEFSSLLFLRLHYLFVGL